MTLCGRWLRADEAAHVTLSTQPWKKRSGGKGGKGKRSKYGVSNQPVVGIAAGGGLTDAHRSSRFASRRAPAESR